MGNMGQKVAEGFQLRQAAGSYWLLNMNQKGIPYEPPLMLNEIGADIWKKLEAGWAPENIAEDISKEYHILHKEAMEDVLIFCSKLLEYGILIGE